ncbi:hypothetical protein [Chamaesiphon sp.]|uniref:hypothetical protein n=1 Tax=Chamaesiphon sp. TaxID=2814140 RepID=UPI0035934F04
MSKRKAVIEFSPNPDNPEHLILHEYLGSLDASISASIMKAVKDKYLPIAMFELGKTDGIEFQIASIESRSNLKAQAEIIQGMVEIAGSLNRFEEKQQPISFANKDSEVDENDDSWDDDDERIPPLDDIQFKGERN